MSVYVDAHNRARRLLIGLYSDSGGHPARRLAAAQLRSPKPGTWNRVALRGTSLERGRTYWIALLGRGGTLDLRFAPRRRCAGERSPGSGLRALPRVWKTGAPLHECLTSAYLIGIPQINQTAGNGTSSNAGGSPPASNAAVPGAGGTTGPVATPGVPIAPMPVIDHGLPAFATNGIVGTHASDANNGSYGTSSQFRCTPPCALTIDLSSVPAAQRQHDLVTWYDDASEFYAGAIGSPYYNEPRDYTIDANGAAGGGSSPAAGWTTLTTVTGNFYNEREHLVNLGGANWIRMTVTAANGSPGNSDAAFNFDVNDASRGAADTWLFLGDSITAAGMGHYEPSNFMQQVQASYPAYFPSQLDGGIGGWSSGAPLATDPSAGQAYIDEFLSAFPGQFVALDYGTNDALGGNASVSTFTGNMSQLIAKVLAAGKVPLLPRSIAWGCNASIQANGPAINADLRTLLHEFPQALPGPDLWSFFNSNHSEIGPDCIHPTLTGGAADYRKLWVQALQADGVWTTNAQ